MSYTPRIVVPGNTTAVYPHSLLSCGQTWFATGMGFTGSGSNTWGTANRAILVPFVLPVPGTVYRLGWCNGSSAIGDLDGGIYDAAGNLLVSTGTTAQSGTNALQIVDVTDTALKAGTLYYMALAANNASTTNYRFNAAQTYYLGSYGCRDKASSFNLPNPISSTGTSGTQVPWTFIELESRT